MARDPKTLVTASPLPEDMDLELFDISFVSWDMIPEVSRPSIDEYERICRLLATDPETGRAAASRWPGILFLPR